MKKYLVFFILIFAFPVLAQKDSPKVKRDPVNKSIEKTPTPTPTPLASVLVFSEPVGANVYLGNQLLGKTTANGKIQTLDNFPRLITLKPKTYMFKFEYPEYQSEAIEVVVKTGDPNTVRVDLKAKFGFLQLNKLPKTAKVLLNEQEVSESDFSWEKAETAKIKIPLGNYQLQVLEKDYIPFARSVEVVDKNPIQIDVDLRQKLGNLLIKSTVGAIVYLDNKEVGTISSSGSLIVADLLPKKKHHLLIERASYQKYEEDILLESNEDIRIDHPLSLLVSSVEFVDSFENGLAFWDAPSQWQVTKNLLRVNGSGIGMPREKNYCDATIVFGLRILNDKGAAWVVRAQDTENYYLFCLNASEGLYPNRLLTYICRKGKIDLTKPEIIPLPVQLDLKVGQTYEVRIKMEKSVIKHSLFSNSTGEEILIGIYKDPSNLFSCGNFGFTAPNGEDFQVHGFVIKPLEEKDYDNGK